MRKLSVVIVNYNSSEYLRKCLASVQARTQLSDYGIVVVDNASTDADWERMRQLHPEVRFIVNAQNLGFSTACNQGIGAGEAHFYLLLNPDTIVMDSALDKTIEFMAQNPQVGIAGCRVLNPDGSLQRASRRAIPDPASALFQLLGLARLFPKSRRFARYNLGYLDEHSTHQADAVSGSFLMFRREVLEDIGFLDEDFFLYGEDLDFCWRAVKKGWKVFFFAGAEVIHYKRRSSSQDVAAANRHYYEAMKIFYRKHQAGEASWLKNGAAMAAIDLLHFIRRAQQILWRRTEVGSPD